MGEILQLLFKRFFSHYLKISYGKEYFSCVNGYDAHVTLFLKFDSGATGLLLTHEAIAQKTSLLADQTGVKDGSKKPEYSKMNPFNTLTMGRLMWGSLNIYPVVLSGWDLFDGRIVEIDYDHSLFIVHPALPGKRKGYSKLPVIYTNGLFCIEAAQKLKMLRKNADALMCDGGNAPFHYLWGTNLESFFM